MGRIIMGSGGLTRHGGGGTPNVFADASGWWRASFAGVDWIGNNPLDAGGDLTTQGVAPTVGAGGDLANGLAPALFNGTTQGLRSTAHVDTLLGSASNFDPFTALAFFRYDTKPAGALAEYSFPPIIADDVTHWSLGVDVNGIAAGSWGGGTDQTAGIAYAVGTYAMAVFRWDGVNIICDVSQPSGSVKRSVVRTAGAGVQRGDATQFIRLGVTGDNIHANIAIYEAATWKLRAITDAEVATLPAYFNSRYGKGLT